MPLPTIPSGNVASAISGAYEVANSCRFDGSSAYLSRTLSTPTNASKFTYSCWVKRSDLTTGIFLFANGGDRTQDNIPEIYEFDKDPRVQFAFGVGGTHKQNSSSWILKQWNSTTKT